MKKPKEIEAGGDSFGEDYGAWGIGGCWQIKLCEEVIGKKEHSGPSFGFLLLEGGGARVNICL